jgi:hypothetical protein
MSNEVEFIDGLIVKAPNERAPEYVKAKLSIKREQLIAWLEGREGEWINADVKVSQAGKWYAAVDSWKPEQRNGQSRTERPRQSAPSQSAPPVNDFDPDSEIPF